MKLLKFILSGPLQSWGEDSRWDQRATSPMPTKSAVVGLLGCCCGYPRGDSRLNQLNDNLHMAVRADCPGSVMTDFHTVQASNGSFYNAEGKPRTGSGNTIITPKQYLQDARFVVFMWGNDDILSTCYEAMCHPKWAVYLGRKSCVPAVPVTPQWVEADRPEEAVHFFTAEEKKKAVKYVRVEIDAGPPDSVNDGQGLITRRDAVLRADHNEYGQRWVKVYTVSTGGDVACT